MFHDFHLLDLAAFNFYAIENSRLKKTGAPIQFVFI
ncbi:MAG: hypothetical protein RLZ33_2116 [Bacteroidota bacterium]